MPKGSASSVKWKHRMDPYDERINSAKRQCRHRANLQDVKRRKAAKEAIPGSSQGSLFEGSRNVEIGGGQFNSTRGHHANITVNVNQLPMDGMEADIDMNDSQLNPVMDNERDFRAIFLPSPPEQRSCDIYYRHMAAKGRGSPIFLPNPSSTLPEVHRRRGIAVGDVIIITASGGIDFLFNVCLPADHPINQEGLPDGFAPLSPDLRPSDIYRDAEFNPNSHLASASIEKSHTENNLSGLAFESSASEGAILTMPQGADAEDLANVSRFRRYLSANAESWYRYVNGIRGREARNGDVRLVIGCDKASSWGMATFANSTAQDFHLKFKPTGENGSRQTYGWEYSGMVEARAGPIPEETENLRSSDNSGYLGVYKNQCLFVRTLNATLRDDIWQGLEFDFETAMDVQYDSYPNSYIPPSSSSPSTRSPSPTGPSYVNSTTRTGSTRSSGITSFPQRPPPTVRFADFNTALTAHPSKTMNDFILQANPHARIAITEDKDWTSLILESDQRLPSPEELINRMLTTHDVCEVDGVVSLQLRQKNKPTNSFSTALSRTIHIHDGMYDSTSQSHPPRCYPRTRVEVLKEILDWTENTKDHSKFHWFGAAGAGKSALAHAIAESFSRDQILFADLFFRRSTKSPSSTGPSYSNHTMANSWKPFDSVGSSPSRDNGALDREVELSMHPPELSNTPSLEECISMLGSIHCNIGKIKAHKEQCQALSRRCDDLLEILQNDSEPHSFHETAQEEIYRVIMRIDHKIKEYGSWNEFEIFLCQQDIRSELNALQTDIEKIITKVHTNSYGRALTARPSRSSHPPFSPFFSPFILNGMDGMAISHDSWMCSSNNDVLDGLYDASRTPLTTGQPHIFFRRYLGSNERSGGIFREFARRQHEKRNQLLEERSSRVQLLERASYAMRVLDRLTSNEPYWSENRVGVTLTDFGLSTLSEARKSISSPSSPTLLPSTFRPSFVAPELIEPPEQQHSQTDVWAFGDSLWGCLMLQQGEGIQRREVLMLSPSSASGAIYFAPGLVEAPAPTPPSSCLEPSLGLPDQLQEVPVLGEAGKNMGEPGTPTSSWQADST